MLIQTTRFGPLEVDEQRLLHFAEGLLGFSAHHRFALLQTAVDPVFYWLQSADDPALAFVVCDPLTFVPDYEVSIRPEELNALGAEQVDECQVLVIVNKVGGDLTANMLGPLVVGTRSLAARQLVLSDKRYGTRHRLMAVDRAAALARTA